MIFFFFFFALGFTFATVWHASEDQDSPSAFAQPDQFTYYFKDELPEYELFHLPDFIPSPTNAEVSLNLTIFGKTLNLNLRPNENLMAPNFKAHVRDEIYGDRELNFTGSKCHYLHQGENEMAAFTFCPQKQPQGIIFLPNNTFEIRPIFSRASKRNEMRHVAKRIPYEPHILADDISDVKLPLQKNKKSKRDEALRNNKKLTIETALFFDEAAYNLFAPYFKNEDEEITDMLLAYMNAIQALYHHPSLKKSIDIVLVKLEILKRQPSDLPHYNGERSQLLDSFCAFNQKHNPKGDQNPSHWDMGLYVSGLDFFAYENGRKSGVTMGLATVGGVCMEKYNCVIAELGTTNLFGKPYPSAGFTSVYVLAHEIGHKSVDFLKTCSYKYIGMHHDSTGNNCPKEGYIMSPSRGMTGETLWSPCSADVVESMEWAKCLEDAPSKPPKNLDHSKFENLPGKVWGAKKQCEILLRDGDAEIYDPSKIEDICKNLKCKTPHRSGFYFAGPALEGTSCGGKKWCQGGSCVTKKQKSSKNTVKGGWSNWDPVDECASACIEKSKGYQPRRRTCTNPKPVNTNEGCEGPGYEVVVCGDEKTCKGQRQTVVDYASKKCKQFSELLPELDKKGSGLQATYESGRLWMSCAIFCKRDNSNSYYTPRLELNDLNVDPYFPDGTWCHSDDQIDYYCVQHQCLPENYKILKSFIPSDDVPISQNAPARIQPTSDDILKYFSIDLNKNPLLKILKPETENPKNDDDWIDKDYIEIP